MLTLNPTFIDMYRGDTQHFDVTPTGLSGGFSLTGSDVVKFTAKRAWNDAPLIALDSPPPGVTIVDATTARISILPADTTSFPFEEVELHFGVEVVRGSEKYTLLAGTMIVRPVVRQ